MTYNSFSNFLNSTHGPATVKAALENCLNIGFSSDCNGVKGALFEISFADEVNSLNLGLLCMTNNELDYYHYQGFDIDCSNFGSPDWPHLKGAKKDLFHPISGSDVYFVDVDRNSMTIKIQDGLSIKTSIPASSKNEPKVYLHNDTAGLAWDVVDNLVNNQVDPRSAQKIGNVLIVRKTPKTDFAEAYFFDGSVGDIYSSFADLSIGNRQNYVFKHGSQAVLVTNRKHKSADLKDSSFNRGIQLLKPSYDVLENSGALKPISKWQISYSQIRTSYMQQRFGF